MADLTSLTPDQIKALGDIAEIAKGVDPTWAKIIGGAVSLLGAVLAIITHVNNLRTKKNTEANNVTASMLAAEDEKRREHEAKMIALKNDAVKEFESKINFATNRLLTEYKNVRVFTAKANAQLPILNDRITKVEKQAIDTGFRVDRNKEEQDQFWAWMRDEVEKRKGKL